MLVDWVDFNGAGEVVSESYGTHWELLLSVLRALPLHLKASGQDGLHGTPIFDPVGTNSAITSGLLHHGWQQKARIPSAYECWGTDVDYAKDGVIVEAQFSIYPFLMNNVVRSELFFRSEVPFGGSPPKLIVIVVKGHMLPASNGTLYFEQAKRQLDSLAPHNVIQVPIRLVNLYENPGTGMTAVWTQYEGRTSRTVITRTIRRCRVVSGREGSRCRIEVVD